MKFTSFKRMTRRALCRHTGRELTALIRVPKTTQFLCLIRCSGCGKQWTTADPPERWLRNIV